MHVFTFIIIALATPQPSPLPVTDIVAPHAQLSLQIASSQAAREHGLMNRTVIPPHTGMLFVFDSDGPVDFWMKDTRVPLDMIFIGSDWRVRSVAANVPVVSSGTPDSAIPLEHGTAKYVIELRAGEAALDGITPGVLLQQLQPHGGSCLLPPGRPSPSPTPSGA